MRHAPPRTWEDGAPVGGTAGYPEAFHEWTLECQARYVVRKMRHLPSRRERRALFEKLRRRLPGATEERVRRIWADGSYRDYDERA